MKLSSLLLKIDRLSVIVFIAGAVVMVLELIGSRILAPYLGTSIYVWASLIGIILGALTIGYYLGGQFSKNNPSLEFLTKILILAGLVILFITIIKEPILLFSYQLGSKVGSIISTLILFALPSLILGMVSPYAIRLKINDVAGSGKVAGNLYALSTIGSIFGTFLAGFYLIPTFGSTQMLYGLSFILILTALLVGKKIFKLTLLLIIVILGIETNFLPSKFIYETDSAYNHIRVADANFGPNQDPIRILLLATESHSVKYKNSNKLFASYQKAYQLDNIFKPDIKTALTLGGGAYISPLDFLKRFPEAKMTVVEIDPKVTAVAKEYFDLEDDPRLNIIHEDARVFLNKNLIKYDVIYGDTFSSYFSIPFQLTTTEAVEKIYNSLSDDGLFILNLIASLEGKKSTFFKAEYNTIKKIFPQVYVFPVWYQQGKDLSKYQNIVLIATKDKNRLTLNELELKASPEQKELLKLLWPKQIESFESTPILTDEFAPVDYYMSKML